ncbi:hypothetical protein DTO027I6_1196 [Penicillium roqueforti]|nr:hypothetical protein CBS147318_2241 [Penicillium roqueforti]KAI3139888.1 hypothetical protein CBS147330_1738 [Penicillium roqueforti]KAI3170346.1 hypothetical protein DTO039G3_4575 [Penicillium roqueforti]KAI3199070.1 hypothetical protein CBS147311_6154 [Penicillium roqueforti]KAI3219928.1 hypothetical protein DTO027I6_1196 [Penicillium roqueforti]
MASQHIRVATPPSRDAILESLVENVRAFNARLPPGRDKIVFGAEQPAEFETVNGHFSAQMHAFFNALHDLEDMADKPSSDDLDLCRPDECPRPVICVSNQSEPYLDCLHRTFYTRCLTVQNPDSLPCLKRVTHTQLRILPDRDPTFHLINIRPVSLRIPLDLATYLPQLRELACPWL